MRTKSIDQMEALLTHFNIRACEILESNESGNSRKAYLRRLSMNWMKKNVEPILLSCQKRFQGNFRFYDDPFTFFGNPHHVNALCGFELHFHPMQGHEGPSCLRSGDSSKILFWIPESAEKLNFTEEIRLRSCSKEIEDDFERFEGSLLMIEVNRESIFLIILRFMRKVIDKSVAVKASSRLR